MGIDKCSLDQTIYSALNDDLIAKRCVDMVFSYYNETTSKVEFTKDCHRIALAAKSRSLHHILNLAAGHNDCTSLIMVGKDCKLEAESLFNMFYNPGTSDEDIILWDDGKGKEVVPELECTPDINYEHGFLDEDIKQENLDDHLYKEEDIESDETSEDSEITEEELCDRKTEMKYLQDALYQPPKVGKVLYYSTDGCLKRHKQKDKVMENSDNSDIKQEKTMQQQPTKSCLPKGLPGMDPFFYCTGFSLTQDQRMQLESVNERFGLSLLTIESMLAQGTEDIGHYKPITRTSSVFKNRKLDALTYQECLIPYFSCRNCKTVIESMDMYSHALKCKISSTVGEHQKKLSKDISVSPKDISIPPKDIDIPHLENLIKNKDPEASFFKHNKYSNTKLGNLKKYFYYVVHKKQGQYAMSMEKYWTSRYPVSGRGRPSPFIYCRLCEKVMEEEGLSAHECVKAISGITTIYENEKSRITIMEEENVNPLYLFIHPVKLDNQPTELAFCDRCKSFSPKAMVLKRDYDHKCLGSDGYKLRGKEGFKSSNLKLVPYRNAFGKRNKLWQCKLCNEKFKTTEPAEIHMRTEHGEGEKQVICSHCGQGFETILRLRKHEISHHGGNDGHGAPSKETYQCTECGKKFKSKGQVKIHMLRIHSSAARSFICAQCGKGFKTDGEMKQHMNTHGENTVQCDLCELKFRNKANMVMHRMRHTGERPNVCPYCHHGFIQLGVCKSHILKIHGIVVPKGMTMKVFCDTLSKDPDQYGQPRI